MIVCQLYTQGILIKVSIIHTYSNSIFPLDLILITQPGVFLVWGVLRQRAYSKLPDHRPYLVMRMPYAATSRPPKFIKDGLEL